MIIIRNIEELEAERKRQIDAWLASGNDASDFILNLNGANLSGADLRGADLSYCNLMQADLSSSDLSWADINSSNLYKADLSGANLTGADLMGADLWRAKVIGSNLTMANLRFTSFWRCDLSFADLNFANLSMADFRGTTLDGTRLFDDCMEFKFKEGVRVTQSQFYQIQLKYGVSFMDGFVIKELEEWQKNS